MALRIGVIGTGMIGKEHIRRLGKLGGACRVVALHDFSEQAANAAAADAPGARVFTSGRDLIGADEVDAIVVTSKGSTHAEYVLAAIAAKKPVFCEKPLATTRADCEAIVMAEVAHGKRLVQVGFMRRYDRAYRALKQTIDAGTIGAPLMFFSVHRNASVPAGYSSDMAIHDTAVHDIDIARYLLATEVKAVSVTVPRANTQVKGLRDPIIIQLEMANGAVTVIEVSVTIVYGYDIRGEVIGETGTASLAESNPIIVKSNGAFHGALPMEWMQRFNPAFDAEFAEWVANLTQGKVVGPSAWDGYAASVATDAAIAAVESGKKIEVQMAARPALYA